MRTTVAASLALLVLTACDLPPPEAITGRASVGAAVAESRAVGNNAVGEACLAQPAANPSIDLPLARAEDIFCGGWTQPAARVLLVRSAPDLDILATASAWRSQLDQRYSCSSPEVVAMPGGQSGRVLACQRRVGTGARHLALLVRTADGTLLADGLPASLPVIERLAAGQVAGTNVARSAALQAAATRLGGERGGAADEARFDRLMQLGRELNQVEDFAGAEDAYRQALQIRAQVLRSENDPSLALPMMHIALNLSNQRRFGEADRLFARAGSLARLSVDRTSLPRLAQYRGLHEMNRGALEAAERLLVQAQDGFAALAPMAGGAAAMAGDGIALSTESVDVDGQNALLGLAETLRARGVVAGRRGDAAAAAALIERGRTTLRDAGRAPGVVEGRTLRAEGMLLARGGQPSGGSGLLLRASDRLSGPMPGERPVATTLFLAGAQLLEAGRTDAALAAFRRGATVLRERRVGLDAELVLPYLAALEAAQRNAGGNSAALRDEAFAAIQLARRTETARSIALSAASRVRAEGDERVAAALRRPSELETTLRARLMERDGLAAEGRATAALDQRIAELRAAREEAESEAQALAPDLLALRDDSVSVAQTRARLDRGEVVVQFLMGDRQSFAVALRAGQQPVMTRLAIARGEAARLVGAVRASVEAGPDASGRVPPFDTAAAARLYELLLRPLETTLEGARSLIVVPDGPLLSLPFAMILTGPGDAAALDAAPWLIRRHAILHTPSVQGLVQERARTAGSAAPRPYIGFGNFVPPSQAQVARSFPQDRCGDDGRVVRNLGALPRTQVEVQRAAAELGAGGEQRLGAAFTAAAVTNARLQDFRIVHFATHGLLPDDLACLNEPSIMVSAPAAQGADAGFITASAIRRLRLDADLVILSACNTGGPGTTDGRERAGEALSGLARAFFAAGARGLLATHWDASEGTAPALVVAMLSLQNRGTNTAEALRQVQLALIAGAPGRPSVAHPFFWAPFALIGSGRRDAPTVTAELTLSAGG